MTSLFDVTDNDDILALQPRLTDDDPGVRRIAQNVGEEGVHTALAAVVSGLSLLVCAFGEAWQQILTFILLGGAAIVAAITYTVGKTPYGYRGFGDISVFLFFGLVATAGSAYVQDETLRSLPVLAAVPMVAQDDHYQTLSSRLALALQAGGDKALTSLDLSYNDLRNAGALALAKSKHLGQLTHLTLRRNHLG